MHSYMMTICQGIWNLQLLWNRLYAPTEMSMSWKLWQLTRKRTWCWHFNGVLPSFCIKTPISFAKRRIYPCG